MNILVMAVKNVTLRIGRFVMFKKMSRF